MALYFYTILTQYEGLLFVGKDRQRLGWATIKMSFLIIACRAELWTIDLILKRGAAC